MVGTIEINTIQEDMTDEAREIRHKKLEECARKFWLDINGNLPLSVDTAVSTLPLQSSSSSSSSFSSSSSSNTKENKVEAGEEMYLKKESMTENYEDDNLIDRALDYSEVADYHKKVDPKRFKEYKIKAAEIYLKIAQRDELEADFCSAASEYSSAANYFKEIDEAKRFKEYKIKAAEMYLKVAKEHKAGTDFIAKKIVVQNYLKAANCYKEADDLDKYKKYKIFKAGKIFFSIYQF